MIQKIKRLILISHIPPLNIISAIWWLLFLGAWLRRHKHAKHFENREQLYDHVSGLIGAGEIDYLEFGVFKGGSTRSWLALNKNPKSRFFGFDTFTGLPEAWKGLAGTVPEGHFSTEGAIPVISDERVTFIKGKFKDTLPTFLSSFFPRSRLVVHCDADLYNSTLYVLTKIDALLVSGTILIFDDFGVANHDFRAFMDYSSSYARTFELLAHSDPDRSRIALRMLS